MQQQSQTLVFDRSIDSAPPEQALGSSTRARWHAAVAQELEAPGVMALVPVVVHGRVLDFLCVSATPRAAALLGSLSGDVVGLELGEITGAWRSALKLVRAYRHVYLGGIEMTFLAEDRSELCAGRVLHQVVRTPTGLSVTLTCPSSSEPAADLRGALRKTEHPGF